MKTRGRREFGLVRGDIVEAVGDALADLVHYREHTPRFSRRAYRGAAHVAAVSMTISCVFSRKASRLFGVDLAEVDRREANHVAAFARDE